MLERARAQVQRVAPTRALVVAIICALVLAACSGVAKPRPSSSAPVRPGRDTVVTSNDGKVTVTIPGAAVQEAGRLAITPVTDADRNGWKITLNGARLVGDATIRFALPALAQDEPLPVVTYSTSPAGARTIATNVTRDGEDLVVRTNHFSNWFVDRWNDLLKHTKDWLTKQLTARVSADQAPKCNAEKQAREDYTVTSDKGSRVLWCLGMSDGNPVLKAINARRYGVSAEYTPGLRLASVDRKDFLSAVADLLTPSPTRRQNHVELLAKGSEIDLGVTGTEAQVGVMLQPEPGAYLLSALDFGISTILWVWERTGAGDITDDLLTALQGEQCLSSFTELANSEITGADQAKEFFANALGTALDCVDIALQAVDVGVVNGFVIQGVIWLITGLQTALAGIVAAADIMRDSNGYQIVITKKAQPTECPNGISLPADIDSRACRPIPETTPVASDGTLTVPSRMMGCDLTDDRVARSIHDYTYDDPPPAPANADGCNSSYECGGGFTLSDGTAELLARGGALNWESAPDYNQPLPALQDGEMFRNPSATLACLSERQGLTCWNGKTGHGFFISKQHYARW